MPNVLVLGASGYLGLAICKALNRSGNYHVWGHTRTAAKADFLESNEIMPMMGDITTSDSLMKMISSFRITVVVDATSAAGKEAHKVIDSVVCVGEYQKTVLAVMNSTGPKLGYVYVSRSGVHTEPDYPIPTRVRNSDSPEALAFKACQLRPAVEHRILALRDALDVAIIRPHAIYGHATPLLGQLWKAIVDADPKSTVPIKIPAARDLHVGVVHLEDVAAAFQTAVDRIHGQLGSWPVFDLHAESVRADQIMKSCKQLLGVEAPLAYEADPQYVTFDSWVQENFSDVSNAKTVLGWVPKKTNFLADFRFYLRAYIASRKIDAKV